MSTSTRFPASLGALPAQPRFGQSYPKTHAQAADPAAITRAASKQSYATILLLADRGRSLDAFRAYGYFRWGDDYVDSESLPYESRVRFIERQQALLDLTYAGIMRHDATAEERMLLDMVAGDRAPNSGLQAYLRCMMAVMVFDVQRRGQLVPETALTGYSHDLAVAVTEALHHFIGHDQPTPPTEARYRAVTGAHITHLLRDTYEDVEAGYYNISREFVEAHGIAPDDVDSDAYRLWVQSRCALARAHFAAGRQELARVRNRRCRLAGAAYIARFEMVLDAIERDGYRLRRSYNQRKTPLGALKIPWSTLRTCAGLAYGRA